MGSLLAPSVWALPLVASVASVLGVGRGEILWSLEVLGLWCLGKSPDFLGREVQMKDHGLLTSTVRKPNVQSPTEATLQAGCPLAGYFSKKILLVPMSFLVSSSSILKIEALSTVPVDCGQGMAHAGDCHGLTQPPVPCVCSSVYPMCFAQTLLPGTWEPFCLLNCT